MKMSLSTLKKTIVSLEDSLSVYNKYENTEDKKLKVALKESVIQSFEVSYEMSRKMIERYLKESVGKDTDQMVIRDVFRLGEKVGILADALAWFDYKEKRNQTSHVYDVNVAEEVFLTGRRFLEDARFLLKKLEERIEN